MTDTAKSKTVALVAMTAAIANIMSLPPLAVPVQFGAFTSSIHFFQLAVFFCGILAGPWAGLVSGAVGSLYMGMMKTPFVVGGVALLGACTGIFAKKTRPIIACLLALAVQVPYVVVTDYFWFTYFLGTPTSTALSIVGAILVTLGLEAATCALLTESITHFVRKAGLSL